MFSFYSSEIKFPDGRDQQDSTYDHYLLFVLSWTFYLSRVERCFMNNFSFSVMGHVQHFVI